MRRDNAERALVHQTAASSKRSSHPVVTEETSEPRSEAAWLGYPATDRSISLLFSFYVNPRGQPLNLNGLRVSISLARLTLMVDFASVVRRK